MTRVIKQKYLLIFASSAMFFMLAACYFIFATAEAAEECKVDCESNCSVYADPGENEGCLDKCKSDEEECEKLNKKAKIYENILKINDKQQDVLADQLEHINQEKEKTRQDLTGMIDKVSELEKKIENLERNIFEKEKSIAYQKKILSSLMQSYYEYDQQGLLGIVLLDKDLSYSLSQSDYIEQSGVKASEILDDIQNAQHELIQNREELKQDYEKSKRLKDELQYKKNNLQSSESQKQSLLIKTQGEEQKYKNLLAHIEEQKLELFNFSGASNLGEVLDSVKNYPKPDNDDQAPTSWYFSQRDSRWGNQRIGNSKSLMKDYGCAVACVSMVFRKNGSGTDPGKMAKEKIFYYDLIKWPGSWSPSISLISSVSHGNVNWSTIDKEIGKGHPAIVYIKKTNGGGGHYVVITGKDKKDYIVHDPYFGSNLYLGTSKSLVGKIGVNSGTKIDQMIIYN